MTATTPPASTTSNATDKTLTERAKDAAATAQEKVSSATSATVDAAKGHPYAAAGIAVGVVAAVAGAAFGATKLMEADKKPAGKPAAKK